MKTDLIPRRTVLKGLGAVMALPWLEAMGLQTGWAAGNTPTKHAAPNRMAILYVPNGVNMDGWRVGNEGSLPSKLPAILAPLAAHKSDFSVLTGLTADCTELNIDPVSKALAATRPTFGGSLYCTIMTLAYRPQMATVRPRVMLMPKADSSRTGHLVHDTLGMVETQIVTKLLDFIADAHSNKINLPYADVIVSGGKGLKNPDNFKLVFELARVLGGEVGSGKTTFVRGLTVHKFEAGKITVERSLWDTGALMRQLGLQAPMEVEFR